MLGNRILTQLSSCEPIVEMLLSLDANPNMKDEHGSTPLTVACLCRGWSICSLLMEAGADLNVPFNMSSPFLASLRTEGTAASPPPPKTEEEITQLAEINKWMREADCRPNDLLSISVRKMLYARISVQQTRIPLELRDRCMHCALSFEEEKEKKTQAAAMSAATSYFSTFRSLGEVIVKFSCCMCGRVLCEACTSFAVNRQMLPRFLSELSTDKTFRVCKLCYSILKEK